MMSAIVTLVLFGLVALVGALVLWVHVRLEIFYRNANRVPQLSEKMTKSLVEAKQGMQQIRKDVAKIQPDVDRSLKRAERTLQDLEYVTDRAEKVLKQLDEKLDKIVQWEEQQTVQPTLPKNVGAKVVQESLPLVEAKSKMSQKPTEEMKVTETPQKRKTPSAAENDLRSAMENLF